MAAVAPAPESFPEKSQAKEVALYSESEYFTALSHDIRATKPGDRVGIMTMSFEPNEPVVHELMEELYAAADRKVEVALAIDAFTFLVNDSDRTAGPLWAPLPFGQKNYRQRLESLENLSAKPFGNYAVVNRPEKYLSNPYSRRSHLKTAVVNDKLYLGGPNLHKTERSDMLVGIEDASAADWIYGLTLDIIEHQRTDEVLQGRDRSIQLDDRTQIMLDSGRPGQSLIMDEAARLISEAKERLVASFQYFPDGKVANELVAAHGRGVEVTPLLNNPDRYNLALGLAQRWSMMRARAKMPAHFFENFVDAAAPVLHSKAIAAENAAIVGSHNFVNKGVQYGTPEIAMLRKDSDFAQAVGSLLFRQAKVSVRKSQLDLVPEDYTVLVA
jgi:phosphatidylserine/phosphatidylglycerophosphate/cardiolipin synthase-like enzyme